MRVLILAAVLSCFAATASAQLAFYDGFNYTPAANLTGQTNTSLSTENQWLRPSAPTGGNLTISAEKLTYPGLATSTGNSVDVPRTSIPDSYNRLNIPGHPFSRAPTPGTSVFFSFLIRLDDLFERTDAQVKVADYRRGGHIAGLHGGVAEAGAMQNGPGYASPIYMRRELDMDVLGTDGTLGKQTNKYELGVMKIVVGNTFVPSYDESVSFGEGETVLIVGEYELSDPSFSSTGDTARLWINPKPGNLAAEATPSAVTALGSTNFGGDSLPIHSFYIGSVSFLAGDFTLDEVRVGTTFGSVIPATGDFNDDDYIDGTDFLTWQRGASPNPLSGADFDGWKAEFGNVPMAASGVPEPSAMVLAALAIAAGTVRRRAFAAAHISQSRRPAQP